MNLIYDATTLGQQVTQLLKLSEFAEVFLLGFDGSPHVLGFLPRPVPAGSLLTVTSNSLHKAQQ